MDASPLGPHSASPAELKERIEAERRGQAFVVFRDGSGRQQLIELGDRDAISIGRQPGADVVLDWDSEVSRIHAELRRMGDQWVLVDDGLSRNGSYVNGLRVQGSRRLSDGDVVRVGATALAYRAPSPSASTATSAEAGELSAADVSAAQRRVLVALCRPLKEPGTYTTPATNRQIADELFLSVDAVKSHLRVLFAKFGVEELPQNRKRAELVARAFRSGLVSERDL